jgi:spore coat polysaccharide biosynthesis protein SpsF
MRVVCLIQARRNNFRLPNKVLEKIGTKTMLQHVVERCQAVEQRFPVHVITPREDKDLHPLAIAPEYCKETDVLKRHLLAAIELNADAVMRVTSDCPFVDPDAARDVLEVFRAGRYDYVANDVFPTYPEGLGVEIFTIAALRYADEHVPPDAEFDRTHVSPFIKRHVRTFAPHPDSKHPLPKMWDGRNICCPVYGLQKIKLSVDEPQDLQLARDIWATGVLNPEVIRPMVHTLVAYRKVIDAQAKATS